MHILGKSAGIPLWNLGLNSAHLGLTLPQKKLILQRFQINGTWALEALD